VSVIAEVAASRGAASALTRGAIGLIRLYQRAVSPFLPRVCRFHPSCSVYAVEAIEVHGLTRGAALAAWRLARCQPFARGGFDPVPPPRAGRAERGR
jgi:putative membrane protein insertion efficiency factor